jgi:carboxyl-terminal processing protease
MNNASRFFGFVLTPILAFALGFHVANRNLMENQSGNFVEVSAEKNSQNVTVFKRLLGKNINLNLVEEILGKIDEKFVDPEKIKPEEISYGLAKGVVASLDDPFSAFMTPDESDEFQESLDGNLEGIGAELTMKHGNVVVVSPLKNSPAMNAGLQPQDVIVKIDDAEISDLNLNQVVHKIRGAPGTIVKLTVARKNADELLDIEIVRQKITVESVNLKMENGVAILEINQFGTNTTEEFAKHLKKVVLQNPLGIVLDLRFNSGGFLEKARDIVSAFISEGKVAIIKSRPPNAENIFVTGEKKTDLPVVVLQNGGSASASEIVAGALKDFSRAKIVGEKSFGKGTVQELIPLKNGGNLRLTVSKWLTPKGNDINEKGVEPDIVVENSIEDFDAGRDPQLQKAI